MLNVYCYVNVYFRDSDHVLNPDPAEAPGTPAFSSDSTYPFPVHHYHFVSQGQHLAMAYMDVQLSRSLSGQHHPTAPRTDTRDTARTTIANFILDFEKN